MMSLLRINLIKRQQQRMYMFSLQLLSDVVWGNGHLKAFAEYMLITNCDLGYLSIWSRIRLYCKLYNCPISPMRLDVLFCETIHTYITNWSLFNVWSILQQQQSNSLLLLRGIFWLRFSAWFDVWNGLVRSEPTSLETKLALIESLLVTRTNLIHVWTLATLVPVLAWNIGHSANNLGQVKSFIIQQHLLRRTINLGCKLKL